MSEKKSKGKKKTGLGLAIWVLAFLIILIVFLVKQEEIKGNFEKSGASELIEKKIGKNIFDDKKDSQEKQEENGVTIIDLTKKFKKSDKNKTEDSADSKKESETKTTQPAKSEEKKTELSLKPAEKSVATEQKSAKNSQQIQQNVTKEQEKSQKSTETQQKSQNATQSQNVQKNQQSVTQSQQAQKTVQNASQSQNTQKNAQNTNQTAKNETKANSVQKTESNKNQSVAETKSPVQQTPADSNMTTAKICFVAIDSNGSPIRKQVTRSVRKDSPMGDALNMVLKGPSATEAKTGCQSLVPSGTRLLGATVKNGVANLNFSEEFQFNQFGSEGAKAQLMQIVYTATEFSTVKSVQILIEGQKRDYLTEGVWIGSPLSRNGF